LPSHLTALLFSVRGLGYISCTWFRVTAELVVVIIIIIIIERRDFGGVMSDDCKDILQTQNKTVRVRRGRTRAYL